MSGATDDDIPVTLLTGFLGSGKTTLLARALREPRLGPTAVIVNELGDVPLDHDLVAARDEELVRTTTGCLCCTLRGDIRSTLSDLLIRRASGAVPRFSRVVIETTGLADPAPAIHTLMTDTFLTRNYWFGGVVATVDSANGNGTLDRHFESRRQVAVADRIVLTKTDLAEPAGLPDRLRALNPGATLLRTADPALDLASLFDAGAWDPQTGRVEVARWLGDAGHAGAPNGRHDPDITTYCLVREEPVGGLALSLALEIIAAERGADLLRVKGILNLREQPDRPLIIHGVQHIFHKPVALPEWPSDDRRTRIVFITRGIPRAWVESILDAFDRAG
ncbi:MAG: CobW family GTP-binding protein [Alphaproteobacteria bacterium]